MRIDVPLTSDLGVGSKKRTLDPSDSHVDIPAAVMPIAEIITPVAAPTALNTNNEASLSVDYIQSKNNSAAWVDGIIDLAPGLWQIDFVWAFNMTMATAVNISTQFLLLQLQIPAGAVSFSLNIARWFTVTGNTTGQYFWRFLLRDPARITLTGPATAVGDTILILSEFVATKQI